MLTYYIYFYLHCHDNTRDKSSVSSLKDSFYHLHPCSVKSTIYKLITSLCLLIKNPYHQHISIFSSALLLKILIQCKRIYKYLSRCIGLTRQKYFAFIAHTNVLVVIYTWEYFCAKTIIALPVGRTDQIFLPVYAC